MQKSPTLSPPKKKLNLTRLECSCNGICLVSKSQKPKSRCIPSCHVRLRFLCGDSAYFQDNLSKITHIFRNSSSRTLSCIHLTKICLYCLFKSICFITRINAAIKLFVVVFSLQKIHLTVISTPIKVIFL